MSTKSSARDRKSAFLRVFLYNDSKSVELTEITDNLFKIKSYNDFVLLKYYLEMWYMNYNLMFTPINTGYQTPKLISGDGTPTKTRNDATTAVGDESQSELDRYQSEGQKKHNAVSDCTTPKDKIMHFLSSRRQMSGNLLEKGVASKGKEEIQYGNLEIEFPDGNKELLQVEYQGIETWLISIDDHIKLLEYLKIWEVNHNDYISDFTHDFGAVQYHDVPMETTEQSELPTRKKKKQPGNFEFGDDDTQSVEGQEIDFNAIMLAKKKAKLADQPDAISIASKKSGQSEIPDLKQFFYKLLECCVPTKQAENPIKSQYAF